MKKPASFDSLNELTDAERKANARYAKYLEGKAKRNKAARDRKRVKVAKLQQIAKTSNRAIDYTREEWLMTAIHLLRPMFLERGYQIPEKVRATVGFPSVGGLGTRIGECHCPSTSGDDTVEMFVSPLLDDPIRVLGVLVHELGHAVLGVKEGHRNRFRKFCKVMELEGKPTHTTEGEPFRKLFSHVLADLGPLPHKKLTPSVKKRQKGRNLKVECPCCGFKFRASKAPLAEIAMIEEGRYYIHCPSPKCQQEKLIATDDGTVIKMVPARIYLDIEVEQEDGDEEE